jgi:hypothetical protein
LEVDESLAELVLVVIRMCIVVSYIAYIVPLMALVGAGVFASRIIVSLLSFPYWLNVLAWLLGFVAGTWFHHYWMRPHLEQAVREDAGIANGMVVEYRFGAKAA